MHCVGNYAKRKTAQDLCLYLGIAAGHGQKFEDSSVQVFSIAAAAAIAASMSTAAAATTAVNFPPN